MILPIFVVALSLGTDTWEPAFIGHTDEDEIHVSATSWQQQSQKTSQNSDNTAPPAQYEQEARVESVVDPCSEPGLDEAAKKLCPGWVEVCPEMTALRMQYGFSDTDLRGGLSSWGAGNAANFQSCRPERVEVDDEPQVSLVDLIYEGWQQLQLPAPVITTQPAGGQTLVNMDTWVQAKQDPYIKKVTLLGQTVLLRADPVLWHWDYGDDSEIVTNDHSGYEYPRMKGYHHYLKMGTYQLKATIEWVGQYAIPTADGSPAQWHTIEGTAKTTATTPIKVGEHRPRLVHPN